MHTLYTYATNNGRKASIMLEELGLPYRAVTVDLRNGENRQPPYLAICPMGKIPAVIEERADGTTQRLFGSGTILLALAEQAGKLIPAGPDDRIEAIAWLMAGIGDLFPARAGEYWLAERDPEPAPRAIARFREGVARCLDAAEARLEGRDYLAGDYSIADIAWFPYVATIAGAMDGRPNLRRWHDAIAARPAVQRGMAVPA
jgi:GSH-dependent disulfide-bond oxidoreductase